MLAAKPSCIPSSQVRCVLVSLSHSVMTSAPMGRNRRTFNINLIPCPHTGCNHYFKHQSGLTQHHHALHDFSFELPANAHQRPAESDSNNGEQLLPNVDFRAADHHEDTMDYDYGNDAIDDNMAPGVSGNVDEVYCNYHLELDGRICDAASNFVPADTIPPPLTSQQPGDWTPYHSRLEFETAEFLYKKMDATYTTWFCDPHTIIRNMLGNPDFKNEMDYAPYREWKGQGESTTHQWCNVMSGDWAWDQADEIAKDPATHSSTFVPVILGSDKTTVSVAMGQNNYYPLYASIGNVHNNVRRAHHNAVAIIGFLAIPKSSYSNKKHSDDPRFRKFKKQLFHSLLSRILSSLKPAMSVPEVVQFGDGHFRRVVCFAYPDNLDSGEGGLRSREVVDILCDEVDSGVLWEEWGVISDVVPFTNDFPRADIHQLLAPDILHQVIKGAFKDHLVAWVEKYLEKEHGKTCVKAILDDINHRTSSISTRMWILSMDWRRLQGPHEGYLPAIEGHVPQDIIRCFWAFLEFCYIVRQDIIAEDTLLQLSNCLGRFHRYRQIFQDTGIRFDGFSLPCQHALCHYSMLIRLFGAPNGICSSITESKHIKAIKEPWRRSSKFNTLGQMLLTNQRLDKLAASHSDFTACRMLDDSFVLDHLAYLDQLESAQNDVAMQVDALDNNGHGTMAAAATTTRAATAAAAATTTTTAAAAAATTTAAAAATTTAAAATTAAATTTTRMAAAAATPTPTAAATTTATAAAAVDDDDDDDDGTNDHCDGGNDDGEDIQINLADQADSERPHLDEPGDGIIEGPRAQCDVKLAHTHPAASFYAPSDPSGVGGMRHEHIHAAPSWRRGPACNDTVLINTASEDGINGMDHSQETFPCAVVHWFKLIANELNPDTGMWMTYGPASMLTDL
ncbi:hypothetical protein BD769DRAFT_1395925 [Suillus cothurnatus]|nr:hypothetical protein BD769DRAFT_1395925 [Suillus cothurnatus]